MNNISYGNNSNPLIADSENYQENQNNKKHTQEEVAQIYIDHIAFLTQKCLPENVLVLEKLHSFTETLEDLKKSESPNKNYLQVMADAHPALEDFCDLISKISEKACNQEISNFVQKLNHSEDLKQILEESVDKISKEYPDAQHPRALHDNEKQALAELASKAALNDSQKKASACATTQTDLNANDYAKHQALMHLLGTKNYERAKNAIHKMSPLQLGLPDKNGDTALILLLKNAQFYVVKNHLINKLDSTQLRHKNNAGQTALDVMKDCHRPKISQLWTPNTSFFASFFNWYLNPAVWSIWLQLPGNS